MVEGFKRYNEIQKAVSAHIKSEGISLKDRNVKFHQIASKVYDTGKQSSFINFEDNLETIIDQTFQASDYEAELGEAQTSYFDFYEFESNYNTVWSKEVAPDNLFIKSFIFEGEILAINLGYNNVQPFIIFCNRGRNIFWTDSGDAPKLRFTKPVKIKSGPKKGYYISELKSDDKNNYGYIAGEILQRPVPPEEKETEIEQEPEKKEKETLPDKIQQAQEKAQERAERIKKLEVESKRLDVESKSKAIELFDRYKGLYDAGILTKEEFKQKVMELKL
ncbi:MAG: hypothetical protein K9H26_18395 [Prolixibacteraceae bacterium]|nr:hypothetical protein [Prolixibacteraceae bacterium]